MAEQVPHDGELLTRRSLQPTAEATSSEALVDLTERADHLALALDCLETAELQAAYLRMAENPKWLKEQHRRYGKTRVAKTTIGKMVQYQQAIDYAKAEFRSAYGAVGLVENGFVTDAAIEDEVSEQFESFSARYLGSTNGRKQRRQAQKELYEDRAAGPLAVSGIAVARNDQPAATVRRFNPTARVNLATALQPEFLSIVGDDELLPEAVTRAVRPENIRQVLLDGSYDATNAVSYPDETNPRRWRRVVFTPAEWPLLLRSDPNRWANAAFNKSEVYQRQETSNNDPDAPRRAQIHMLENADADMTLLTTNQLQPQLDLINRFKEAALYNGNLLRFGNEVNMRAQLLYLWDYTIADTLWSVRIAHNGSPNQDKSMLQAVEQAVFLPADPAVRLKNFGLLLDVLADVTIAKRTYITWKRGEVQRALDKHQTPQERTARIEKQDVPRSA